MHDARMESHQTRIAGSIGRWCCRTPWYEPLGKRRGQARATTAATSRRSRMRARPSPGLRPMNPGSARQCRA